MLRKMRLATSTHQLYQVASGSLRLSATAGHRVKPNTSGNLLKLFYDQDPCKRPWGHHTDVSRLYGQLLTTREDLAVQQPAGRSLWPNQQP